MFSIWPCLVILSPHLYVFLIALEDAKLYRQVRSDDNVRKGMAFVGTSPDSSSKIRGIEFLGKNFEPPEDDYLRNRMIFQCFHHLILTEPGHRVATKIYGVLTLAIAKGCAEKIKDDEQLNCDIWKFLSKHRTLSLFAQIIHQAHQIWPPSRRYQVWHSCWESKQA